MDTSAVNAAAAAVATDAEGKGRSMEAMTSGDFLEMLITELTNQDPFEPVKNADLMNQIGSIRSLEMNDRLADSLEGVVSQTGELTQTMESMMLQSNLNAAHSVVGKLVSGVAADESQVAGQVVSVRVADGEVVLKLDNGFEMPMTGVNQVIGPEDLAGRIVVGRAEYRGHWMPTSGEVESVQAEGGRLLVQLANGRKVPIEEMASAIRPEDLVGKMAIVPKGENEFIQGVVTGYEATGAQVELELDTGERVALGLNTMLVEPE